jgi:membrane fusion protein, multidrug efflux system
MRPSCPEPTTGDRTLAAFHYPSSRPLAVGLLLLVGLAGCGDAPPTATIASANRAERSLPVQALELAPRDLSRTLQLSAAVEPLRLVELAARTDGVLTSVLVEEGDSVKVDQVLARIDVREQQAELARAEAALAEQRSAYARLQRLQSANYVDAASLEAARAGLAGAEADRELWRTRVEFGTARASLDGVVIARNVEPGAAIGRLAPLFTLADTSVLVVRIAVSELDIANIIEGQSASVRIDALDTERLAGRVRRVFPSADPSSRLTAVEIELPDASARGVRPGFLARVELVVEARLDVLAVPLGAIAQAGSGEAYVMVINEDSRLEQRAVTPGATRGLWREITGGLQRGERIVASNPVELRPGTLVRIVSWLT